MVIRRKKSSAKDLPTDRHFDCATCCSGAECRSSPFSTAHGCHVSPSVSMCLPFEAFAIHSRCTRILFGRHPRRLEEGPHFHVSTRLRNFLSEKEAPEPHTALFNRLPLRKHTRVCSSFSSIVFLGCLRMVIHTVYSQGSSL